MTADPFNRFMAVFPKREGEHDRAAAWEAWERAIRRADPEAIIAGADAYRRAREGQPQRFTMSARRWLQEARWRDMGPALPLPAKVPDALVWIALDAPGWREWEAFYRATKGKTPPLDRRGGWRFPSRYPPTLALAAE